MHKKYKQLASLILLLASNLSVTGLYSVTSTNSTILTKKLRIPNLKGVNRDKQIVQPSIPRIKKNTKTVESDKLPPGFTYIDGLCLDKGTLGSTEVYQKAILSSYEAQINEIKRRSIYLQSLKNLALPTLQLDLSSSYTGFDLLKSDGIPEQPLIGLPGKGVQLGYKVTFDLSAGVFGFAKMITEQQSGSADFHVSSINLYFEICKAIQTYLICVKKLKCMQAQAYDFKKDDDETQARYKVGSVSRLTALQSRQWLNTAVTKVEERQLDLVNAKTKLLQYTPHLTDDDFRNLDRLSTTHSPYTDLNLENLTENELEKLPVVIRTKLKSRLARINGINGFLKTILPILNVEATPLLVESKDAPGAITMKATWSMGLNTIADCGNSVLDTRKTILESQREAQIAKTEQVASIRQYKLNCRILKLLDTKVEGCIARLSQHDAMDRNDPETHLEKRSKLKEELYKVRLEQIDQQDKVSVGLLEYLRLTGLLTKDISDSTVRYNNQMELDKYKSNCLKRSNTDRTKKMQLPGQTKPGPLLLTSANTRAEKNTGAVRKANIGLGQSGTSTAETSNIDLTQQSATAIRNSVIVPNMRPVNSNAGQNATRTNSGIKILTRRS